jgi:hypothetical protein
VQPVQTCAKAPAQVNSLKTLTKLLTCARVQPIPGGAFREFKLAEALPRKTVHPCTGQRFPVKHQYFDLCILFCTGLHRLHRCQEGRLTDAHVDEIQILDADAPAKGRA